jgi:hypothetical protein
MAGLDVVNEQIIEINVTSPCYFIKEINNNFCTNIEKKVCDYILSLPKPSQPSQLSQISQISQNKAIEKQPSINNDYVYKTETF